MKVFIVLNILFVVTLFSKTEEAINNSFMFKPMLLSEERNLNQVDSSSTMFSFKDNKFTSFQDQFKDYAFIIYLNDLYQNVYRYSSINSVIFKDENNLLSFLSSYDVSCSKIKLSLNYNFK